MNILLAVDVQREFVKDEVGESIYKKCIDYINEHAHEYDCVFAAVYQNGDNPNMQRLVGYNELKSVTPLEFISDRVCYHSGYSIKQYPELTHDDNVDIIGFDTDACVLSAAFRVFDIGCGMRLLTDFMWSSGGEEFHDAGLTVMKRQFGKAVIYGEMCI